MTTPTARERAATLAEEICIRARWSTKGDHYGLTMEKLAGEILAAERAAAERMRERCAAYLDGFASAYTKTFAYAEAIRALPLEENDLLRLNDAAREDNADR